MHETVRRFSAQLDAKLGLPQTLIVEANRAAARLEDALDRAWPTLPPGSQAESLRPMAGQTRDLSRESETAAADSNLSGLNLLDMKLLDMSLSDTESDSSPPGDRNRRREEIYRLADYGLAVAEIARRVGSPVGEVELILGLRGRSEEAGPAFGRGQSGAINLFPGSGLWVTVLL